MKPAFVAGFVVFKYEIKIPFISSFTAKKTK
jgi:hypothetical protein